jgi:ubiquinone/menaquinone biosynthesis C-methylase UbiE
MIHKNKEVLAYWNKTEVESMYDKHLINIEIDLISSKISEGAKILDAGCGEGEGTLQYAKKKNTIIHAVDFSETRLLKAKERLSHLSNITLKQVDFLSDYNLDKNYDFIISQRFLINLLEWNLQKKVILDLAKHLKKGGRLLMLEGSQNGVKQLNDFRTIFGLKPIDVKWHNLFFKDKLLERFLKENNLKLIEKDGLGEYFLFTRGIRPYFDNQVNWDSNFNKISTNLNLKESLNFKDKFSRLKLWIIEK